MSSAPKDRTIFPGQKLDSKNAQLNNRFHRPLRRKLKSPRRPVSYSACVKFSSLAVRQKLQHPRTGNRVMKEVSDYLARARECREMMERALPEQKGALEEIATTWERLAEERQKAINR